MGQTLVPELCPQSSQQMNPHNNIGNHENQNNGGVTVQPQMGAPAHAVPPVYHQTGTPAHTVPPVYHQAGNTVMMPTRTGCASMFCPTALVLNC
ncbi:hypothetical protein [Olleya sp. HaHaR_3_96]|uniref:hypothetical protein n=1 Tax=Olleya sp. HaHaR_3_96 TaxID=2745560 RepID=UPI001C5023BF|nr:hypothetical protein [Olleya sp. HaHaR_3_96]QXP58987.1 hypothetical protein H0I26_13825 [Olleya sp. HaHaR_3_96]